ncbi:IS1595 family transposase [Paenibacillus alkalitolerans]|uniref:IS1595 family transposase n=1 Tax=Paenibacillus alkalitolerans TaxID=2799335 RepID=UPI0018F3305E|nr:IS1595 family transposase [Paenibacillus alkalitolerans]
MVQSREPAVQGFLSEEDCIAYFYRMKWPDGFRCPRCEHSHAYTVNTRRLPLYECRFCRHQTSLTAGTAMEGSRTPLHKWAVAMQLVSQPASINAVQLAEQICVTYKTAWSMLRKIRQAISDNDAKQPLSGAVRAGPAFYGRTTRQPFVRHPQEHPVMVGAAFHLNGQPSYIKVKTVPMTHMDGKSILRSGEHDFVERHVEPETFDVRILKRFRLHEINLLPEVFKQAKKWINRTFHGIGAKYLQNYLDEFCFRCNQSYRDMPVMDVLSGICLASAPRPAVQ